MRVSLSLAWLVAGVGLACSAASAQPITFSGTGAIGAMNGKLGSTGMVPIGSAVSFDFAFDSATAMLVDSDVGYALYGVDPTAFSAALGTFSFPLSTNPALKPVIELSRGFAYFDGDPSTPSVDFSFYFFGQPTGRDGVFAGAVGRTQQLTVSGIFKLAADAPLTVDTLLGLGDASYQHFQYTTRDPSTRQSGNLYGDYVGGLSASVPEPATWALLVVGFGAVGGALRGGRHAGVGAGRALR